MDSNLLKVFIIVANLKSISKAAAKLKLAQSNVTSKIQQLEKKVDNKLFHRVSSGVVLTKEGEKLYLHAVEIIKKIEIATLDMKNMLVDENLKIGSTEANAIIKSVDFLVMLNKEFPDIELELFTNTTENVKKMLLEYEIDIGFVSGIPIEKEFEILNKIDETLVFVESKARKDSNTLLSFKKGCAYNAFAKKYVIQKNIEITKNFEFASYETILGCVEAGIGKSILPLSIIEKLNYKERLKISNLEDDMGYMPTYLICRKDSKPKIIDFLKNINF